MSTTDQIARARTMSEHDRQLMDRAVKLGQYAAQAGITDRETVAALILADAIDASMSRAVIRIGEQLHQSVLQLLVGRSVR